MKHGTKLSFLFFLLKRATLFLSFIWPTYRNTKDGPFCFTVPLNTDAPAVLQHNAHYFYIHWFGRGFSCLMSDFSLTNSLATSSFVRWERIRRIVQPVSSIWMRLPKDNQQAQEPWIILISYEEVNAIWLYLINDILQLHHCNPYQTIFSGEAIVFNTDMQLIVV